jgi:hypothetical protein
MAPAIASRGEAERARRPARAQSQIKVALLDRHDLKSRATIDAVRRRIFAEADDVGSRFAEAGKIHNGLVPERAIHGQASIGDARAVIEEGVPVCRSRLRRTSMISSAAYSQIARAGTKRFRTNLTEKPNCGARWMHSAAKGPVFPRKSSLFGLSQRAAVSGRPRRNP